jgi:hypothetical protein
MPLSKMGWMEVVPMWTTKLLKLASLSLALMAYEIANGQQPATPGGQSREQRVGCTCQTGRNRPHNQI